MLSTEDRLTVLVVVEHFHSDVVLLGPGDLIDVHIKKTPLICILTPPSFEYNTDATSESIVYLRLFL